MDSFDVNKVTDKVIGLACDLRKDDIDNGILSPSMALKSIGKPRGGFIQTTKSRSGAWRYAVDTSAPVRIRSLWAHAAKKMRNVACRTTPEYVFK